MAAANPNQPGGTGGQPNGPRPAAPRPAAPRPAAPQPAAGPVPLGSPPQNQPQRPAAPRPIAAPQAAAPRPIAAQPGSPQPTAPRPVPMQAAAPVAGRPNAPVPVRPIPVKAKAQAGQLPVAEEEEENEEEKQSKTVAEFVRNAPAWLISTVFHMLILIIMGLWMIAGQDKKTVDLEIRYAEQLGEQLNDDSVLFGSEDQVKAEEQIITPKDLTPVDDPLAAMPQITDFSPTGKTVAVDVKAPMIGLALRGREAGSKNVLLGAYGGNATTEGAVLLGLEWLAKQQRGDGTWSLTGPYPDGAQEENSISATAMALLAFQGQGNTHQKGKFKANVAKGWAPMLKHLNADGDFFRAGPAHHRLYTQAQCTIALCELYGMTLDSKYREPAQRAIKYAIKIQDKKGGWRYIPGEDSDTSVTGWFVMALQSAKMAKLEVPGLEDCLKNITRYLDSAQTPTSNGMQYDYTPETFSTNAVTAEGLLCRQYLGWKQTDPRLVDGVKALNKRRVDYNGDEVNVYYWYYATQACHHMEGDIWRDWNSVMRQEVPSHQTKRGAEAGSWDPGRDKFASNGGRLYTTCLSIYMLEVYYRHLPIYSGFRFLNSNGGGGGAAKPEAAKPEAAKADAAKDDAETK